jgi:hypothetical protein
LYTQKQVKDFVIDSKKRGYTNHQIWEAMIEVGIDRDMLAKELPDQAKAVKPRNNPFKGNVEAPRAVKVIGVLYYIEAGITLILSLFLMIGGVLLSSILIEQVPVLAVFSDIMFILSGIFGILFAVIYFYIARGLFRATIWARVMAVVFSVLGLLYSLLALAGGAFLSGIFCLVLNGFIIYYLIFNQESKYFFDSPSYLS